MQAVVFVEESLIGADGAATPLGSCFSRMRARGGAFTLHPWLMASKPPACWSGEALLRGSQAGRKLYVTFSCTLYRVFRETKSVVTVFCDFRLVRRQEGVSGGFRSGSLLFILSLRVDQNGKSGSADFHILKKSS